MRVLLITNMYPSRERPQLGVFVRDQLESICALTDIDVELFAFAPGKLAYPAAVRRLRHRLRTRHYDLFHAHYGLTGWVAWLAGCRPLLVTFHGTDLDHPRVGPLSRRLARRVDLAGVVSRDLGERHLDDVPLRRPFALTPPGVDLDRFRPIDRREARRRLGLAEGGRYALFPADPARPEKRFDRASVLLRQFDGPDLIALGGADPEAMPLWINAADVVLVTSDREGFGLGALEALACDVPVFSTPVGIAPDALATVNGALCAPFDLDTWRRALARLLEQDDPRVSGRDVVVSYSSNAATRRLVEVYGDLLAELHPGAAAPDSPDPADPSSPVSRGARQ